MSASSLGSWSLSDWSSVGGWAEDDGVRWLSDYYDRQPVFSRSELEAMANMTRALPVGTEYFKAKIIYDAAHNYEIRAGDSLEAYQPLVVTPFRNALMPVFKPVPISKLMSAFENHRTRWQTQKHSPCEALGQLLTTLSLPPITKIVAFGLGSMQSPAFSLIQRRSTTQHAMLLYVVDFLHKAYSPESPVSVFLQDPAYRDYDKAVLASIVNGEHGLRIVEDPQGFLEIDNETLVISICPDIPVRTVVADIAKPAAMIWCGHSFREYVDQNKVDVDPSSPRLERMLEDYTVVPYPTCPLTNPDERDQVICVRKQPMSL